MPKLLKKRIYNSCLSQMRLIHFSCPVSLVTNLMTLAADDPLENTPDPLWRGIVYWPGVQPVQPVCRGRCGDDPWFWPDSAELCLAAGVCQMSPLRTWLPSAAAAVEALPRMWREDPVTIIWKGEYYGNP